MHPDQSQETQWIEEARAGSLAAFDRLMVAWEGRLFRFLQLRGLSSADAQDVLQETFLQAYRHLAGYRPRWRFSTWLFTIAVREAARHAGGEARGRSAPPGGFNGSAGEHGATPVDACLQVERRDNLWRLARRLLNDDQFSALWLCYGEGFSGAEIARSLNRSRAWVKVNLHRARRRLAVALDEDSEHPLDGRVSDATVRS